MNKKILFSLLSLILIGSVIAASQTNVINLREIITVADGWLPVVSIDKAHFEIHQGEHYFIKTWVELTGPLNSDTYFAFTTPVNTKEIHARALLAPDADTVITIYEGGEITGGTQINGTNNKRDSINNATLMAYADPTIVDLGDPIWTARNGGGRNPVGVAPGLNYEIIAKNNVTYIFEIEKETTTDTIVDIDFFWYEESFHE